MQRDWNDFKSIHSNIAGAREAFEDACETLFRKIYEGEHVQQVRVKRGDGGIDIFIGEIGVDPITVLQCKFFIDDFGDSQKQQIRESFKTAINNEKYKLKEWILCVPMILDIDESSWWAKWKKKKLVENGKQNNFIQLKNGNELIDLMKEHGLYDQIFQIKDSLALKRIEGKIDNSQPPEYFIELSKKYGVCESAVNNFFKHILDKQIELNDWDCELRKIAKRHKTLQKQISNLESDDPVVSGLQQKAKCCIERMQFEEAEKLLYEAVILDNQAAEQLILNYKKRKKSAAENQALIAESLHNRFEFNDSIDAYKVALHFAAEAEAEDLICEYQDELAGVLYEIAEYKQKLHYSKLSLDGRIKLYGEDSSEVAESYNNLGVAYLAIGDFEDAILYLKKALASDIKTFGEEHEKVASKLNNVGAALKQIGDFDNSIQYLEQALASDKENFGENHVSVSRDLNNLGTALQAKGIKEKSKCHHKQAFIYLEQALKIDIGLFGRVHPNVARDYNCLGVAYKFANDLDKGIGFLYRALTCALEFYGEQHPYVASTYCNLGQFWRDKRNYCKAITYAEKSLALKTKIYDRNYLKLANSYFNLGSILFDNKNYNEAKKYIKLALTNFKKSNNTEDLHVGKTLQALGNIYKVNDDTVKAIDCFKDAINYYQKTEYSEDFEFASLCYELGILFKKEGEIESAISYFGLALAITIDTFGENHQSVARIHNQLGTLWGAKGDYDKAIYFFNLSLAYNKKNLDKDHPIVITCKNNLKFASEKKLIKMNAMAVPHQIHAKGSERNRPCICGSGKKFKKCCGLL